jgi:hypothetical protein
MNSLARLEEATHQYATNIKGKKQSKKGYELKSILPAREDDDFLGYHCT